MVRSCKPLSTKASTMGYGTSEHPKTLAALNVVATTFNSVMGRGMGLHCYRFASASHPRPVVLISYVVVSCYAVAFPLLLLLLLCCFQFGPVRYVLCPYTPPLRAPHSIPFHLHPTSSSSPARPGWLAAFGIGVEAAVASPL